ncbi:extracellular solute-binding protein [Cryobacterium sp. MDB2-10]|uniref:Extracellular solute-binding protein n=1 Tax=Cryobacterium glucosi TaxID=1259175 RepID=A0ABY2INQ0_9MICO|nr:extracellular solute-binding protein [Cryobacterium sp. MDB2-A-1]TFC07150.1 extracellular solute-binding protein [Cryobacterium sp. MDB2-33-2]TFC15086.1 extracellular solute-binding protein [Cryobacterium sp. MDB2-A-2]TFC18513.1 extracellular solute-binding protein [Cryobacterium sp. MDB2-10]TFC18716.1 extracellular solute-binding protein [Cryobacterium glucosi]
MKRIRTIAAVVAVAAVFATTACTSTPPGSSSDPSEKANLTFWSWVPGVDKAVDLWNKENPNIQVKLEQTPAGSSGTYAKMYSALKAGKGAPDLAQIEYQELPGFVLENGLVDLKPLGMGVESSKFVDWQLGQSTFGDSVYAVPQASGPMGLYYREDIFSALGLKAPATWDEYAVAAKTIHDANPAQYINTFAPGNSAWFTALAWQAGAKWFGLDGDTWTVNIDSDTTLKVASYWDKLREAGLIKTEPDFANGWYSDLQNGNIVAWPSAQWGGSILSGNAPTTAGKWKVAPLPQWDSTYASANWGGSSTAVLKGTSNAQAAEKFAVWLNTDPQSISLLLAGGYGWPAAKNALAGSTLDKPEEFLGGQNANKDVFKKSDESINTSWGWIPTTANTYTHLNDGFQAAVEGHGTFVDAVKAAQTATIADLEAKGLKVRAGD